MCCVCFDSTSKRACLGKGHGQKQVTILNNGNKNVFCIIWLSVSLHKLVSMQLAVGQGQLLALVHAAHPSHLLLTHLVHQVHAHLDHLVHLLHAHLAMADDQNLFHDTPPQMGTFKPVWPDGYALFWTTSRKMQTHLQGQEMFGIDLFRLSSKQPIYTAENPYLLLHL